MFWLKKYYIYEYYNGGLQSFAKGNCQKSIHTTVEF